MLADVVVPLHLPLWIDLAAIVVGALSGATFAVRLHYDFVGVLFLAVAVGLGGGIVRDVLLGVQPAALSADAYMPTVALAAIVGFFFATVVNRFGPVLMLLDALSLALFTVVGVEKALLFDIKGAGAMFVGVAAATGGGVIRDVVSDHPVEVLRRGPLNAAAALLGGGTYVLANTLRAPSGVAEILCVAVVAASRLLSVWRGWETVAPIDLSPAVVKPLREAREAARRRRDR